jgi:spermidine/putrescine transport system ATP-binding protein
LEGTVIGVDVASIGKGYGTLRVLDQVSASFKAGQFTSLLGPSGSGKTTLLRIIGGFIAPDEGQILFGGEDVTQVPLWQRKVGMVFQSYALFPHMSVHDNVIFGLNRHGIKGEEARKQVAQALEMVHLTGFEQRKPKQLSGGQQQRVALARAIVTKPRVLLLDEPLSALDRRLRQDMQIELRRIQRDSGLTTIFVTHDQEEALTLSDTVAILDRGRIIQEGAPLDIYERPRTRFAASFLGDANFFSGTATADGVTTTSGVIRTVDKMPVNGTKATLAVRPEKMRLVSAGDDGSSENLYAATVREIIYAGAVSTFIAEGADGTPIKILSQNREATMLAPGQGVTLAWSPEHTVLMAD